MTSKPARPSTTVRPAAKIASLAAAYVAAHEALIAAIARIDKIEAAGVPASAPAARQAVAAWDAAYTALEAARESYQTACEICGLYNRDVNESEYELELYAPWDWDMPEAYVRLSRI